MLEGFSELYGPFGGPLVRQRLSSIRDVFLGSRSSALRPLALMDLSPTGPATPIFPYFEPGWDASSDKENAGPAVSSPLTPVESLVPSRASSVAADTSLSGSRASEGEDVDLPSAGDDSTEGLIFYDPRPGELQIPQMPLTMEMVFGADIVPLLLPSPSWVRWLPICNSCARATPPRSCVIPPAKSIQPSCKSCKAKHEGCRWSDYGTLLTGYFFQGMTAFRSHFNLDLAGLGSQVEAAEMIAKLPMYIKARTSILHEAVRARLAHPKKSSPRPALHMHHWRTLPHPYGKDGDRALDELMLQVPLPPAVDAKPGAGAGGSTSKRKAPQSSSGDASKPAKQPRLVMDHVSLPTLSSLRAQRAQSVSAPTRPPATSLAHIVMSLKPLVRDRAPLLPAPPGTIFDAGPLYPLVPGEVCWPRLPPSLVNYRFPIVPRDDMLRRESYGPLDLPAMDYLSDGVVAQLQAGCAPVDSLETCYLMAWLARCTGEELRVLLSVLWGGPLARQIEAAFHCCWMIVELQKASVKGFLVEQAVPASRFQLD